MVEPWVYTASLDAVDPNSVDPDRPIAGRLTKLSRKPARAGLAMIQYARSTVCLRDAISRYLADNSCDALAISTQWCCDLDHPDDPARKFDKHTFFPGRFVYADDKGAIYAGDNDEADRAHLNAPKTKKRKAKGPPNRLYKTKSAPGLHLHTRPIHFVQYTPLLFHPRHEGNYGALDRTSRPPQETEDWGTDWGAGILAVISSYDAGLDQQPRRTVVDKQSPQIACSLN
ncbi:hypothetical protein B0H13DRAFT_2438749 [Mycena leptocephala]|nr:hypothetical protein B0H13DRAFT_2438749 [Mycena leptocephala]